MSDTIDRREFMKRCAVAGAGVVLSPTLSHALQVGVAQQKYTVYTAVGDRTFDDTMKVVDALGGMRTFVRPATTVGILVNSPLNNRGAYVNPDIPLAIVKMCLDAGANKVVALNDISGKYWKRSTMYEKMRSEVERIQYSDETREVTIDKARSLKKADISAALLSCDVYINIPIIKDHEGTRYTCSLKNVMGACSGSTCRRCHYGEDAGILSIFKDGYSNIELLAQSIADVNLVRRPDLCVVDATEFLVTNGPSGPGEVRKQRAIIATTNCLAADTYAVRYLGLDPDELPVIRSARGHGYGPANLKEIEVHAV